MDPSGKESLLGQVLGSAVIGAVLGLIAFIVIALLGVSRDIALLGAALLSALVISTFSRYQKVMTGPFKSPILLPTTIGTLTAGAIGIAVVWFELLIHWTVASLIIGMVAGCVAAVAAGLLKSRME
jgi:hypothetical protein